jgi:PBP1b-binding outer membrane lipoprotein LpoB
MKTIFIISILTLLILAGCQEQQEAAEETTEQTEEIEGTLAPNQVDVIPEVNLDECIAGVKTTNPEMTEQNARDNCLVIEAVNKQDKTLCDQVSADFKEDCLALFAE